jgi:hypothetical protein
MRTYPLSRDMRCEEYMKQLILKFGNGMDKKAKSEMKEQAFLN